MTPSPAVTLCDALRVYDLTDAQLSALHDLLDVPDPARFVSEVREEIEATLRVRAEERAEAASIRATERWSPR